MVKLRSTVTWDRDNYLIFEVNSTFISIFKSNIAFHDY